MGWRFRGSGANSAAGRAVEAAASAPVSARQVQALAVQARKAFDVQGVLGNIGYGEDFDVWRKGVLWDCCQKTSFKALGQREWEVASAAFRALAGGEARPSRAVAGEGDRRRAVWGFRADCRAFDAEALFGAPGGAEKYAEEIASDVFGRGIARLDTAEITKVRFSLRSRASARRRRPGCAEIAQDRAGESRT